MLYYHCQAGKPEHYRKEKNHMNSAELAVAKAQSEERLKNYIMIKEFREAGKTIEELEAAFKVLIETGKST